MSHTPTDRPRYRFYGLLAGLTLILGAVGSWAAAPVPASRQGEAPPEGEAPIEVVIVQGFVKSIDAENLVLTAPGAPHDLPLLLHPDTRYVNGETDVNREEIEEGQFVRAALIPAGETGEDLLAIVVEIVPDDEGQQEEEPAAPPGDPGNLGEPDPLPDNGPDTTDI